MVKYPPASAGDLREVCSIPGSEISPGGGCGNPDLQYFGWGNPMDREDIRGAKTQTGLKRSCQEVIVPGNVHGPWSQNRPDFESHVFQLLVPKVSEHHFS